MRQFAAGELKYQVSFNEDTANSLIQKTQQKRRGEPVRGRLIARYQSPIELRTISPVLTGHRPQQAATDNAPTLTKLNIQLRHQRAIFDPISSSKRPFSKISS